MRISSQLLLTFLLNSLWQIALIAALAAFGSWLLRNSVARYRHWLWVSALCLAFLVPAITSLRTLGDTVSASDFDDIRDPDERSSCNTKYAEPFRKQDFHVPSTFQLNQTSRVCITRDLFRAFLLYRIFKLVQAWQTTRTIRRAGRRVGA